MLYESLVGQCEYTTQLLKKLVLVLFHSHLGMLQNPKSEAGWAKV